MYHCTMETDSATPKPKRTPSGAAVAGAHPRPTFYPRQLVIMASDALADEVERLAKSRKVSKSEVGRMLMEAGLSAGAARSEDQAAD
jgi:hypothetical protein